MNVELQNITVQYLPPNTTAKSQVTILFLLWNVFFQPMDQNVIETLKTNYRRLLLREIINKMEARERFRPNLLQALRYLKTAWEQVKEETIRNAFKAARFIVEEEVSCSRFIHF